MAAGRRSKTSSMAARIRSTGTVWVAKVSMCRPTGRAEPMA